MDAFFFEESAFSFLSPECFAQGGDFYNPNNWFSRFDDSNRNCENWDAVGKVCGSVNWVDDPFVFAFAFCGSGFFADDFVIWKILFDGFDY